MSKFEDIQEGDFVIRVRPTEDAGEWTGEIDISIISQANNPLDDESYGQVMHFCKMMASTIPVMETNEDLRDLVHDYVMEHVDKEYEVELEDKPKIIGEDGNVVKIDFATRTKGNA